MHREFEEKLEYKFNDRDLLATALTHSSYAREMKGKRKVENNERLEFLGDALVDLIIGDMLYHSMPTEKEGNLSKLRAKIVCEAALWQVGNLLSIGKYMVFGKGEYNSGGANKPSIIADAMEAIIGAIYLDGGFEAAYGFVAKHFATVMDKAKTGDFAYDYKTALQEKLQRHGNVSIQYETYDETGPAHDKTFFVKVFCHGECLGKGQGKSKKMAEHTAARDALENIEKRDEIDVF